MANILITGASRGMGLEFVRQYMERGDHVFAGCRNPRHSMGLQKLKGAHPDELTILPLDVADMNSIRRCRMLLDERTESLDLLINNAGAYSTLVGSPDDPGKSQTLGHLEGEGALGFFRVNAVGALLVAQETLGLLEGGENPKIVSLSSGYGSISSNTSGFPYHYSASKAALNMYMRSLAADLKKRGVTVAVLDPGWVRTDMGGPHATLSPERSVKGMIRVIDKLTFKNTSQFLTWKGKKEDW
jgi:NAD(P)-dependent dehydrogenase (short-subunit alcohol dehydrogenase family)